MPDRSRHDHPGRRPTSRLGLPAIRPHPDETLGFDVSRNRVCDRTCPVSDEGIAQELIALMWGSIGIALDLAQSDYFT